MSETTEERTEHDEIEDLFSDYYEGELGEQDRARVQAHLEACDRCAAAYQELKEAIEVVSGLGKVTVAAPPGFERDVESTIERRSGGRFFGDRKLTDRLPLTVLALIVIAVGVALYLWQRSSETGSLKIDPEPPAPVEPGVRDVLPQP